METMSSQCAACGAPLPSVGTFCPACGTAAVAPKPALGTTGGIPDRIAGALAYVLILPAIFFLVRAPYNKNRFIRFHSWQSILVGAVTVILFAALLAMMGRVLVIAAGLIIAVGWGLLWLVLMVKALQGEIFKLPLVGKLAEKQANPS